MSTSDRATPFRAKLRQAGLRVTGARLAVLSLLARDRTALSHQEVNDRVVAASVDRSTVFRALQDLVSAGLVRRIDVGDHTWRYELAEVGGRSSPHPHLLCLGCGGVTCLGAEAVAVTWNDALGSVEEVIFKGRCLHCTETATLLSGGIA